MAIRRGFRMRCYLVPVFLCWLSLLPAWGAAYVRVNQIGYVSGASLGGESSSGIFKMERTFAQLEESPSLTRRLRFCRFRPGTEARPARTL